LVARFASALALVEEGAWNLGFASFLAEIGVGVERSAEPPRRARRGMARWLRDTFFRARLFADADELERAIALFVFDANHSMIDPTTGVVAALRIADERRRLRPLPWAPVDLVFRMPGVVGPGGEVAHGAQVYSMPPAAAGSLATLLLGRDELTIIA